MKKKIIAALTAILLLAVFAGCSKNTTQTSSDTVSQISSETGEIQTEIESEPEQIAPSSDESTAAKPVNATSSAASKTPNVVKKESNAKPYALFVNRSQNIVTVYSKDGNGQYTVPVKAMICSVGKNGATPVGNFNTQNKYVWRKLVGNVYGQYATRITGSILFHSVPYFTQNKGDLEYNEYNLLGNAASLGCVRLSVADAKWIYENCPLGTPVTVYDSDKNEPLARPSAIKIDTSSSARGWDPTDPDPANPWKNVVPETPKAEPEPQSQDPSSSEQSSGQSDEQSSEETGSEEESQESFEDTVTE